MHSSSPTAEETGAQRFGASQKIKANFNQRKFQNNSVEND